MIQRKTGQNKALKAAIPVVFNNQARIVTNN